MGKNRGRRARRELGQALVMGCVLLLVVSLATVTTVQVGEAIHQRVRLQNAADAAAYSMAAVEARAFNLYAYANRAQVSHYVSAMVFQSIDSFLFFAEAFLTDVYGVMLTLNPCGGQRTAFWAAACPELYAVPGLGPVLKLLDTTLLVFEKLVGLYQRVLRSSGVDERMGGEIIPALRTLNGGLAGLATAVMLGTLGEVLGSTEQVIEENAPGLPTHPGRTLTAGLSACLFDRAHAQAGNGSPVAPNLRPELPLRPRERRESSPVARAKRVMAQLANASRYACDGGRGCPEGFVTSRKADLLPLPQWLSPLTSFLGQLPKWGTTRLGTFGLAKGVDARDGGNYLREPVDTPDAATSMLAQGDNLGADDLYALALGPGRLGGLRNPLSCDADDPPEQCWGDPRHGKDDVDHQRPFRFMLKTSVWASNDDEPGVPRGGVHWRVASAGGPFVPGYVVPSAPNPIEQDLGLNRFQRAIAPGLRVAVYVANVRPLADGNHRWRGLAPFPHFEPGQFSQPCGEAPSRPGDPSLQTAATRRDEFNQPSTWVALNQPPPAAPVGPAVLGGSVRSVLGGGKLDERDDRVIQAGLSMGPGLNAIARGQVYYHRPGNWAEQPNFFNPYWRPRLAAVLQSRDTPVVSELVGGLPLSLQGSPQKVLVH